MYQSNSIKIIIFALFFILLTEKISLINIVFALAIGIGITMIHPEEPKVFRYINLHTVRLWSLFIITLLVEVIKANFQVAAIALSPKMPVAPRIVTYVSALKEPWLLTILANAITLTPGTMTIDIKESNLTIHCLNDRYVEGLKGMALETILIRIEKVIGVAHHLDKKIDNVRM